MAAGLASAGHATTPQCTVRRLWPEIETIYRRYQVLLLNREDEKCVSVFGRNTHQVTANVSEFLPSIL